MQHDDPKTRLTEEDGVITVESDSLYVALTTLAQRIRGAESFTINGTRTSLGWTVRVTAAVAVPAQRAATCRCLPSSTGRRHAENCPVFLTRISGDGERYWARRNS
jgi:hypothetical protein